MDAQAYLIRHGWSGPGNPLNPNQRPGPHGGLGLTKPILVARKQNNHGVGKKTTKDPTNQWWLRGFEDALKGMGEDKSTSMGSSNALTSELYRHFVRGECLAGTIEQKKVDEMKEKPKSKSKSKRKRDSEDEDERRVKKEEKAARKEEKRKRRKVKEDVETTESTTVSSSDLSGSEKRKESKEEHRLRKLEKKQRKQRKSEEKKLKKSKRSASEEDYPTPTSIDEYHDDGAVITAETDKSGTTKEKREKKESKKTKSKNKDSDGEREPDFKKSKMDKKEKKDKSA